jgi:selenocysteine lyase/cysteine desulfurase
MKIDALRRLIPATAEMVYMNTGWAGPSPDPVLERIREVLHLESHAGPASLEGFQQSERVYKEVQATVAGLLHASPEEMLLTHGTTEGVNIVLHGLRWEPGDELVTCDLEHPALRVPASVLADRYGVVVKNVEAAASFSVDQIVDGFREAIDPRTKVVALSHVQYSCGLRMPIREIAEVAHEAGALLLVDGAQSAGQIALDAHALGADFYAVSGQKWLLGPLGTGALFVDGKHRNLLSPLFTLGGAHIDGFPPPRWPLEPWAMTSQSVALLAGLDVAIKTLSRFGMDAIEERCLALAAQLRSALAEMPGCAITSPDAQELSCGLVSVAMEGWEPQALVDELWESWRIAARAVVNPSGVRFSTAVFNTEEEVDLAAQAMLHLASLGGG